MKPKNTAYNLSLPFAVLGFAVLFALIFCYIVCGAAIFSLGLMTLPCALLHMLGVLFVATDLSVMSLALIGGGCLLFGAGMLLGTASVCPSGVRLLHRYMRWRRRRKAAADEKN